MTDPTLVQILSKLDQIELAISELKNTNFDGWLDLKKAVEYSGLRQSTLDRAYRRGTLKMSKKLGKTLVKRSWIDRFLGGR